MKICIVQEAGRHAENANFRECLSLQRALQDVGVSDVGVWGKGFDGFDNGFPGADWTIVLEQYDDGWIPAENIRKESSKVIYWSIDTHIALEQHMVMRDRLRPDKTYTAVRSGMSALDATWLPNCVDTRLFTVATVFDDRPIYVGFCGSVGGRRQWVVERLRDDIGMVVRQGHVGAKMVTMLNNLKISFNMNASDDVNYRTFESMACGCVLLTNETPGLSLLFESNDYLIYHDLIDCKELLRSMQGKANELREIAARGRRKVNDMHTYRNRALQIINEVAGSVA